MYIKNSAFVGSFIWSNPAKFVTIDGNIAHKSVTTPNKSHNNVYLYDNFFFLVTAKINKQKIAVIVIKINCNIVFNFLYLSFLNYAYQKNS